MPHRRHARTKHQFRCPSSQPAERPVAPRACGVNYSLGIVSTSANAGVEIFHRLSEPRPASAGSALGAATNTVRDTVFPTLNGTSVVVRVVPRPNSSQSSSPFGSFADPSGLIGPEGVGGVRAARVPSPPLPTGVVVMRTKFCLKCSEYHSLHYVISCGGSKHLIVDCPKGEYATKYETGLNLPVKESRRLCRMEARSKQEQLL